MIIDMLTLVLSVLKPNCLTIVLEWVKYTFRLKHKKVSSTCYGWFDCSIYYLSTDTVSISISISYRLQINYLWQLYEFCLVNWLSMKVILRHFLSKACRCLIEALLVFLSMYIPYPNVWLYTNLLKLLWTRVAVSAHHHFKCSCMNTCFFVQD